jgi:hypothetical protein
MRYEHTRAEIRIIMWVGRTPNIVCLDLQCAIMENFAMVQPFEPNILGCVRDPAVSIIYKIGSIDKRSRKGEENRSQLYEYPKRWADHY